jgi:hypothetical protein
MRPCEPHAEYLGFFHQVQWNSAVGYSIMLPVDIHKSCHQQSEDILSIMHTEGGRESFQPVTVGWPVIPVIQLEITVS